MKGSGGPGAAHRFEEAQSHYLALLNAILELEQALDRQEAPDESRKLVAQAREICRSDYRRRFE